MASEKQKMLAGELYRADDPELLADYTRAQERLAVFNAIRADRLHELRAGLERLVGHLGDGAIVKPPFYCDYGFNIRIGAGSFVNYDCTFLDCSSIEIGAEVLIGPGVHLYTATHPLSANTRRSGLEGARAIFIGDGAWIGGRSVICPGVTIGANAVIGAGSIVTRDIAEGMLAVGSPCRPIRSLD